MCQSQHAELHKGLRYIHNPEGRVIGALGPVEAETVNDGEQFIMTARIRLFKVNELGQLVQITKANEASNIS